jgi:hypothetical protein
MSEARHQLLITLVHGTWPRGFFPRLFRFKQWVRGLLGRRQPWEPPPFWFEEGSPFLVRLSAELRDIPHKITRHPWTGRNSIYERNDTAHALAERLSVEHTEHPQATQLVIAHSHGGNIALRALHLLHQPDGSRLCDADGANPLVITLATPFIEVHKADFGSRPMRVRRALLIFLAGPLYLLVVGAPLYFLTPLSDTALFFTVQILGSLFFAAASWGWIEFREKARQGHLDKLHTATRLGELLSTQRLLVIRTIDDEASLTLALGAILNYVTARSIAFIMVLYLVLWAIIVPGLVLWAIIVPGTLVAWFSKITFAVALGVGVCSTLTIILFGILLASRSVHGRELAISPMECQINTQSTPDGVGAKIITLVRRTYVKSLRHGIYDHEDCAKTIAHWVRLQLPSRL